MEQYKDIFHIVTLCLNTISILVIVWGVAIAAKDFFVQRFSRKTNLEVIRENTAIKNTLGSYILLSLEILIAADIIDSILNPGLQDILRLAAVVAIRTVISYFLNREIAEASGSDSSAC